MKLTSRTVVVLLAGGVVAGLGTTSALAASPTVAPTPAAATASVSAGVSDQVKADLAFAREEERVARDLYRALADKYNNARPFSNIVTSESRHFDAVGVLLQRYGIADPSAGKPAGKYANAELQRLYDQWLAQGSTSLAAAYQVGVALEKRDIDDLKRILGQAGLPTDVTRVYRQLLAGSENHLAAYTAAVSGAAAGTGYPAQQGRGAGAGMGGRGAGQGAGSGAGMGGRGAGQGAGSGAGSQGSAAQSGQAGRRGNAAGMRAAQTTGTGSGLGRPGWDPSTCPLA